MSQLQSRRREAELTEVALWHWSLNLQAKVTPEWQQLYFQLTFNFLTIRRVTTVCVCVFMTEGALCVETVGC